MELRVIKTTASVTWKDLKGPTASFISTGKPVPKKHDLSWFTQTFRGKLGFIPRKPGLKTAAPPSLC